MDDITPATLATDLKALERDVTKYSMATYAAWGENWDRYENLRGRESLAVDQTKDDVAELLAAMLERLEQTRGTVKAHGATINQWFDGTGKSVIELGQLLERLEREGKAFPINLLSIAAGYNETIDPRAGETSLPDDQDLLRDYRETLEYLPMASSPPHAAQAVSRAAVPIAKVGHNTPPTPIPIPTVPAIDKRSGDWVDQDEAAKLEGLSVGYLKKLRGKQDGGIHIDVVDGKALSGMDEQGRTWRKDRVTSQTVWYLKSSLTSQKNAT